MDAGRSSMQWIMHVPCLHLSSHSNAVTAAVLLICHIHIFRFNTMCSFCVCSVMKDISDVFWHIWMEQWIVVSHDRECVVRMWLIVSIVILVCVIQTSFFFFGLFTFLQICKKTQIVAIDLVFVTSSNLSSIHHVPFQRLQRDHLSRVCDIRWMCHEFVETQKHLSWVWLRHCKWMQITIDDRFDNVDCLCHGFCLVASFPPSSDMFISGSSFRLWDPT